MRGGQLLKRIISGGIKARTQRLSVPDKHQLRIARNTIRMHCIGAAIMGGPNHFKAASIIKRLSGAIVGIDTDCTCEEAKS